MSIGFLTDPNQPIIWRGPMLDKAIRQFLNDVEWGDLDYLIVDLPPGTGDAQLSLAQALPLTGAVIVTTPQDVALADVRRGIAMFVKVEVPVLGVVENMSYFVCGHCGEQTDIFGRGGGERISREMNVPFLGQVPLDPPVRRQGGDTGQPIVILDADSPAALALTHIAELIAARVSVIHLADASFLHLEIEVID
jgi:ATP-binding protein involved in chromosome partitioning